MIDRGVINKSVPFVFAGVLLLALAYINLITKDAFQYRYLAQAFLAGKTYFLDMPLSGWNDTAIFNGQRFWPLGPLPAVLAAPFVWLGVYHQGAASFLIAAAVFALCYFVSRRHDYSAADSIWMAIAFVFATSFAGAAAVPFSWYFAHVVAVLFQFLAIAEYLHRRRWSLIGLALGLAMASRPLCSLNALFFGLMILTDSESWNGRIKTLAAFSAPLTCAVLALCFYNFARFGSPWETGYNHQVINDGVTMFETAAIPGNISGPLFQLSNIAINAKTFLFGLPNVAAVGTGVFIVSPFLIYLALPGRAWQRLDVLLVISVLTAVLVMLTFRSTGAKQIGYRFSLDYLPFVFWLLVRRLTARNFSPRLSRTFKALVSLAVLANVGMIFFFLATRLP